MVKEILKCNAILHAQICFKLMQTALLRVKMSMKARNFLYLAFFTSYFELLTIEHGMEVITARETLLICRCNGLTLFFLVRFFAQNKQDNAIFWTKFLLQCIRVKLYANI